MAEALLEFKNLTLGYEGMPTLISLDGSICSGSMLAVVGPNGAGKSTLLKGIMGQVQPISGDIICKTKNISYMPQLDDIARDFPISVLDFALSGLIANNGIFGGVSDEDILSVVKVLHQVGLCGLEKHSLRMLSGGQFQRLLFARLALQDADLLLLDEPFSAMDENTICELMKIVTSWNEKGKTILAVLHDFAIVRDYFPEALLLSHKKIAWGETKKVLDSDNIKEAHKIADKFHPHSVLCHDEV